MPGSTSEPVVETLKLMNGQTGKHATWLVRVLAPRLVPYNFQSRGTEVKAVKFLCILVSKDPRQFMIGSVPFTFADPHAAEKASAVFKEGVTFEIKSPEFDMKMKTEYMSTPIKRALLLAKPTVVRQILPIEPQRWNYCATYVDLGLSLTDVMKALDAMSWNGTQSAVSDTGGRSSQLMNLCGKILSLGSSKTVTVSGKQRTVASLVLVEESQATVEIQVWDKAITLLSDIPLGHGVTIVGCTATRDVLLGAPKLNMWDSAFVLKGGPKVQTLTNARLDGAGGSRLTATFVPGANQGPLLPPGAEGFPTCAASLACAPVLSDMKVFQVNRCMIDAPTRAESMFTQDGKRLYATCRLRDWSGSVEVEVVDEAMPQLYGCDSPDEVRESLAAGCLTQRVARLNARGIIRREAAGRKFYICKLVDSPLDAKVSGAAMKATLGLADIVGDIAIAAPVDRVLDAPLLGLAVRSDTKGMVAAHRVILLVKGTCLSQLRPLGAEGQSLTTQSFQVNSCKAKCLLSDGDVEVDLHGYCSFGDMLQYRLDKDAALVVVSAWDHDESASTNPVATIEAMTKVTDVETLKDAMRQEWYTALAKPSEGDDKDAYLSPAKSEYWDRSVKKLKRMQSEATHEQL